MGTAKRSNFERYVRILEDLTCIPMQRPSFLFQKETVSGLQLLTATVFRIRLFSYLANKASTVFSKIVHRALKRAYFSSSQVNEFALTLAMFVTSELGSTCCKNCPNEVLLGLWDMLLACVRAMEENVSLLSAVF